MKLFLVAILAVTGLVVLILAVGAALPAMSAGTVTRDLQAPMEIVHSTIWDIARQPDWRTSIASIAPGPDGTWTETTQSGERITFRLTEVHPTRIALLFESSRGYTGQWQADLATTETGGTRLTVTEQATTPWPLGRILSRLFFDPEAFAGAYLDELGAETARRSLDREDT